MVDGLRDVRVFAERLIGEPLWPHQAQVALSPARTRVMCCGRQAGKSRTLAVIALHGAFTQAGYRVLVLSAGEDAAKDLMAEISGLASSPLLAGSVVDDNASRVTLTNGSTIRCVPASEKQVRGKSVDLLILDEAAQIPDELWRAARYSIIARPESRVVLASTPFGGRDRFFAQLYHLGTNGAEGYASFHWPSTVSPLVDAALLEDWRRQDPEWVFRQEVLAEWVEDEAAYFTAEELLGAVADYELWSPERVKAAYGHHRPLGGAAGLDWGFAQDANAVVLMAPLDDRGWNHQVLGEDVPFYLPWLESHARMPYGDFIDRLVTIGSAFDVRCWASETNGVGGAPTQTLTERLWRAGVQSWVAPVWTDTRRKQAGFGAMKVLLQQGRLVLPRHPELLRQLHGLQFTHSASGMVQISVPARIGHDDLAMAAMQAVSCLSTTYARRSVRRVRRPEEDALKTGYGLLIPQEAVPLAMPAAITAPSGGEKSPENAW
ncbi:terminase large subunit domain-containing protein [Nonomuraea endophytica]|uniref:TcmA/NAT10 helicase domain-containing protein n=1 Tax=Nonomuraea endophytica TaxID=714136 RepID=A0A7W7ZXU7_9ACTN|nr:terminase family protein [Nonomuraea endophytica]MBB5075832.1 hypothetical protein [Nonomuraea endophytica]